MSHLILLQLLHIDDKVGSVEVGKDADLVLWNGNPLSIYSKVLKTYVDGACYYDSERDLKLRENITKERARIINKMIAEGTQVALMSSKSLLSEYKNYIIAWTK